MSTEPYTDMTEDSLGQDYERYSELNRSRKSFRSVSRLEEDNDRFRATSSTIQRGPTSGGQDETQTLRDQIRYLELQLNKSRENNSALTKKLNEASDDNSQFKDQIARQAAKIHNYSSQVNDLTGRINTLSSEHRNLVSSYEERTDELASALAAKDREIMELKDKLAENRDTVKELATERQHQDEEEAYFKEKLEHKAKELEHVRQVVVQLEKKIDTVNLDRGSEGVNLIQIDQLKADNKRLLELLQSTKEFHNFSKFAEVNNFQLTYLKPSKSSKSLQIAKKTAPKKRQNDPKAATTTIDPEKENWIPGEAWQMAHQWRTSDDFSKETINTLLCELNKIWSQRERRTLQEFKQQSENKLQKLRRQMANKIPYSETQLKKQVARQKDDISKLRHENITLKEFHQKSLKQPAAVNTIDETLKVASALQNQRNLYAQENERLKGRVQELEAVTSSPDYEHNRFIEGALWLSKKFINECENLGDGVGELSEEFHRRVEKEFSKSERDFDPKNVIKMQAWLLDTVESLVMELKENCKGLTHRLLKKERTIETEHGTYSTEHSPLRYYGNSDDSMSPSRD